MTQSKANELLKAIAGKHISRIRFKPLDRRELIGRFNWMNLLKQYIVKRSLLDNTVVATKIRMVAARYVIIKCELDRTMGD